MPATDCAIIILAGGNSSRLGTPKQRLIFQGKTLLQHAIDEAIKSGSGEVVVVTGADHDNLVSSSKSNARFVYNEHWQQGMASSVQAGLSHLLSAKPDLHSVLIMLCDQPFASSDLLQQMMAKKEVAGKGIVACMYDETVGVPVLFAHHYFSALLSLKGAEGAKKIIMRNPDDVATVLFPLGSIDIDTKEDYRRLTDR